LIDVKGVFVKASPFKKPLDDCPDESRMIIEQNNFVIQSLHTIGQQLDCIEEKFSSSPSNEIPLISLPEDRKSLGLKPKSTKTLEKIESMLSDLKINQPRSSKRITPLTRQMTDPNGCTLLIQSSTQNASISVPKMLQWNKLTLPNEWLLENVSKPANMATTSSNVDIIEQYLNGDVKINFADLYPSGHVQRPLANENRRNSFAGFATTDH
jgi:hypothetical protein